MTDQLVGMVKNLSEQLTDHYKKITGQHNLIFKHVSELRGNMIEIKMLLEKNIGNSKEIIDIDLFDDNNNVTYPCQTIMEFEDFDRKLKSDASFRNIMVIISLNYHKCNFCILNAR